MPLRALSLPDGVAGKVYLSAMPGRTGDFIADRADITSAGIDQVISLASPDEIAQSSPDYAAALIKGDLPWAQVMLPVPDYGVALDRDSWLMQIRSSADHVRRGGKLLIHCGYGIGRTGTAAICLMMTFGVPLSEAAATVDAAGSRPEDARQIELTHWAAELMGLDH